MSRETDADEDDYRMISEIQHFAFCRRQWALIHIEQQWKENLLTTEGMLMHKRVHDETISETRKDLIIVRGMRVKSRRLGCSGICDAVEFRRSDDGIQLHGREGKWKVMPVEYKRGKAKTGEEDELQLCAQTICLEEMLCCAIPQAELFYGEPHRRVKVEMTEELRGHVESMFREMGDLYHRQYTPKVRRTKACNSCSLKDICLPGLEKTGSVASYIAAHLENENEALA